MKHFVLLAIIILFPTLFFGQIRISENIQNSQINTSEDNALYFVDFWATWCGPCIHASKYLTSLQRQYPEKFHIMSLSQENPDIVKRFMTKHVLELAVAIDYQGETFSKYNISSLPYGVLLNAKGEKLWEGHPAEFKNYHLDGYLSTNKTTMNIGDMYQLQSYKPIDVVKETGPKTDFDITEITDSYETLEIIEKPDFLQLTGSLKDIIAYINNAYRNQISISDDLNKMYRMRFKYDTKALKNMERIIFKQLKLKQKYSTVNGEVLFLNISDAQFWDINQINWGNDTPHFLIGDSDLKADNVSLNQVTFQLANLLELPIVTSDEEMANTLHDWELHYKYFDLMASNLSDTYGVKIEKKVLDYPNYIISRR
ncbi:TlpA family protein disulfide reductase [Hyunsoonleella flava]|nr:TlpA family protein disulfide reductase [Hyunsoonleella flava]